MARSEQCYKPLPWVAVLRCIRGESSTGTALCPLLLYLPAPYCSTFLHTVLYMLYLLAYCALQALPPCILYSTGSVPAPYCSTSLHTVLYRVCPSPLLLYLPANCVLHALCPSPLYIPAILQAISPCPLLHYIPTYCVLWVLSPCPRLLYLPAHYCCA